MGASTGSSPRIRSVITVPWRTADSNAAGRSALPRMDPLTSGMPRSTNSACSGWRVSAPSGARDVRKLPRDRALHVLDRGPEPLDHLGELVVGARVGGSEEHLVARVAVGLGVRRR